MHCKLLPFLPPAFVKPAGLVSRHLLALTENPKWVSSSLPRGLRAQERVRQTHAARA